MAGFSKAHEKENEVYQGFIKMTTSGLPAIMIATSDGFQ
jgi:hypothetical protein